MRAKAFLFTLLLLPSLCAASAAQTPPSRESQIALHSQLARQYLREKRPDLALPELQKIVALDPDNLEARGNLGVLFFFRGDYKDAVPQLRAAVKLNPSLWKLQALLGIAESELGASSDSMADLEAAFPHLNGDKIQREVGELLMNGYATEQDFEKAAAVNATLLAAYPTDTYLLYMSYLLHSDLAGKAMLTLALVAPESAEMHRVMARELAQHGDNAPAIANYREAIRLNPKLPGLHTEFGDLLFHSDDMNLRAQAGAEFKAALAVNPRDERAELRLGMVEIRQGNRDAAYTHFSRALELNPDDSDACLEMAKILITMDRRPEARKLLEKAIRIDPTNDVAHYRLATLYREEHNEEGAKQQVALYLKYKQMRDKMQKIFQDMRVLSPRPDTDAQEEKKP